MTHAPIISSVYLDATPWPYLRGPNYTRPVFAEESKQGNFRINPIIRMPALNGLGCGGNSPPGVKSCGGCSGLGATFLPGNQLDRIGTRQGFAMQRLGGLGDDSWTDSPWVLGGAAALVALAVTLFLANR